MNESKKQLLTDNRKAEELVDLITKSRTVLSSFAKAKTAKLGRCNGELHVPNY